MLDPNDGVTVLQHHIPSGVQALATQLREAFGQSDQELTTSSLESFFELRRGKLSLQEYASDWELRYEEASTRAGLEINNVAKTFLFFRNSGLPNKFIEDVKLQIQGDMSRFQEARRLALRLSSRGDGVSAAPDFYGDVDDDDDHPTYYDDTWTQEDSWTWDEDDWWSDGADVWYDAWQEEWPEEWHSPEEYTIYDEEDVTEEDKTSTASPPEDYYQYKGKGGGCAICGSKWHHASQCPVNQSSSSNQRPFRPPWKGKSSGKSGFRKGKSKGKGFGKKGKSYGKAKYSKGKSKYGGFYAERFQPNRGLRLDSTTSPRASASRLTPTTPRPDGVLAMEDDFNCSIQ